METSIDPRPDTAARRAGWLLLLTAAATGAAFVVWLTLIGFMLVSGRVERIFASLLRRKRAEEIARRYRKEYARGVAATDELRGWADRGSWPEDG